MLLMRFTIGCVKERQSPAGKGAAGGPQELSTTAGVVSNGLRGSLAVLTRFPRGPRLDGPGKRTNYAIATCACALCRAKPTSSGAL